MLLTSGILGILFFLCSCIRMLVTVQSTFDRELANKVLMVNNFERQATIHYNLQIHALQYQRC